MKDISKGRQSLYLDFYPPVRNVDGGYTRREFLNRFVFKNPKSLQEKQMNKENMLFAEGVKNQREKDILNEKNGVFNNSNKKRDFIDYFKNLAEKRNESKGNYGNWLSVVGYLIEYTGGKCKMGDLTESFCEGFKAFLLTANKRNAVKGLKLSQNSASSYFSKFKVSIDSAVDARLLSDNPLKFIKGIGLKESFREFLTEEELKKLIITECDSEALKNVALFSAYTGLRWSDIESLHWRDVQNTGDGFFLHIIQKKTRESIVHPIHKNAIKLLGEKGNPHDRIFEGLKYSDSNNNKIKRWVLKAGIHKKITLHNFRHTYASLLINKGADIFTVSKMLGHKNIKTTMAYTKIITESKINAANLINFGL